MRAGPGDHFGEVGVARPGAELGEVGLQDPGALVLLCARGGRRRGRRRGLSVGGPRSEAQRLTDVLKGKMRCKDPTLKTGKSSPGRKDYREWTRAGSSTAQPVKALPRALRSLGASAFPRVSLAQPSPLSLPRWGYPGSQGERSPRPDVSKTRNHPGAPLHSHSQSTYPEVQSSWLLFI